MPYLESKLGQAWLISTPSIALRYDCLDLGCAISQGMRSSGRRSLYKRPNAATNPLLGSPLHNCGAFLRPFCGHQRAEGPRQDGGVGGAKRGLSRG
jgi:hypothetical protein